MVDESYATSSKDDSDKMSKGFHITSVCRNDILQMIEDRFDNDNDLMKIMLIKGVENITDDDMRWLATRMSDDFCDCCFWSNLEYRFNIIIRDKYNDK